LDGFVEVLDPEVELHSMKGLRKGRDAARLWATRAPGGVQQTIELEELYEDADRAVALIRRAWHWDEDGSPAGEDEMAWMFELRERRIRSWRPFEDRGEALRVGGFKR
jgi:ketosteroid isomerase-like protein